MVAVRVRVPGAPGMARSDRSSTQVTVAVTDAGAPTGTANPEVSTDPLGGASANPG